MKLRSRTAINAIVLQHFFRLSLDRKGEIMNFSLMVEVFPYFLEAALVTVEIIRRLPF